MGSNANGHYPSPSPTPGTSITGSPYGNAQSAQDVTGLTTIPGGSFIGSSSSNPGDPGVPSVWIPGSPGHATSRKENLGREDGIVTIPGMTAGTPGQWLSPEQARLTPYTWTQKEIDAFKKAAIAAGYAQPSSNFFDLVSVYAKLVDQAASFGAVGKKVTPDQIMSMFPNGAATGGPQGPQALGETDARGYLEAAMSNEMGQGVASPGDVSAFQSAAQAQMSSANSGNISFNPADFATEYVRKNFSSAVKGNRALGFYNSALNLLAGGGVQGDGEINTNVKGIGG